MQMFPETLKVIAQDDLPNIAQILKKPRTLHKFKELLETIMTPEHLCTIAELTVGQSDTSDCFFTAKASSQPH